ncbi:heavy metal translocating P-type ATPase [Breznakiella homolactica]|uniref:P-type Zn(2+) transporter n=1 Tax=Breznakiella homolactica TaxID=2798577 RepID=A0A7T8B9V8_9SPIR|nr:heavy metal translocating P-type ATPase [Breznakiella homolactica]QQO08721.1 heavy metal translocating P-type ATPase [Breznakiella homolactica]
MEFSVVHSLPGRIRCRTNPDRLRVYRYQTAAHALSEIPGIRSAEINPRTGSFLLYYDDTLLPEGAVKTILENLPLDRFPRNDAKENEHSLGWSYIGYLLYRFLQPAWLRPFLTVIGAVPFLIAGVKSLIRGKLTVDVLDASAITVSLAQKNYSSASTLTLLLKTGEYLERWAKQRSRENLVSGISLNVGQVWVRKDGEDIQIPYSQLKPGDRIVLRAGTVIPVDGEVHEGDALVNESSMTGEPLAAARSAGDSVHAGTVIAEGELIVRVLRMGEDTRYQRIVQLIHESEAAKSKTEARANEIADKVVPFSFIAAGLTYLLTRSPMKAASVLSVDYSCAIKLSTPLVFLAAMREGLANGVFFKGGAPMETLAEVDTIVFDKTGTLSRAVPEVAGVVPFNGYSQREVLKIAACLEEHFPHPVAKAVVRRALEEKVEHKEEHTNVKYIVAHGIATEYKGRHTVIGSRHFVYEDEAVDISAAAEEEEKAAARGFSVLYLARENVLAGIILIHDPVREEAAEVIAMLRQTGIQRIYMLTGDNRRTAARVSEELGLDGFLGEVLPNEKAEIIRNLKNRGCSVAVVGDGMNDSPAMSAADVGIAMKDGADLAQDVADITLKDPSLYPLVIARLMAQRSMKRIRTNTVSAIAINSALIIMGIAGNGTTDRSVWLHNLTTLGISMNSMRPLLPESKGP